MSWLDRAKKALNDVAASANTEAQMLKLQAEIAGLEGDRDRQLLEAGRRARDLYRARQISDNDLAIVLKRVDDIDTAIEALRAEVFKLRGEKPGATPT
jgi:LPS sulfotransferase NodH